MLAITVAGIATALTMGVPIIERLRNKAALENVVGQFEEVRAAGNDMYVPDEARYPTVSVPSGTLSLELGTHAMVTVGMDPAKTGCDFRVTDWEDWDAVVTITAISTSTDCQPVAATAGSTAATNPCANNLPCVYVALVDGSTETRLSWTRAAATSTTYTLNQALSPNADYVFRLADAAGTVVYAEARLLNMDRLHWSSGAVQASFEGGSILVQEESIAYLAASPLVSEDPPVGSSCADLCPFFLRFPTLQAEGFPSLTGAESHSVGLVLRGAYLRLDWKESYLLRLDFHGELAESWCNAFLLRDTLAALDGDFYQQDVTDLPHNCTPPQGVTADVDRVRSVKYLQDNPGTVPVDPIAFRFTLSQTVIDASILI